jgi:hypothetical protein
VFEPPRKALGSPRTGALPVSRFVRGPAALLARPVTRRAEVAAPATTVLRNERRVVADVRAKVWVVMFAIACSLSVVYEARMDEVR